MKNHSKITPVKGSYPRSVCSVLVSALKEPVTYVTFAVLVSPHIVEWLRGAV